MTDRYQPAAPAEAEQSKPRPSAWVPAVLVAVLVAATSGTLVAYLVHRTIRAAATTVVTFSPDTSLLPRIADVPRILARTLPAVVGVRAEVAGTAPARCGAVPAAGGGSVETGSGVIVTRDGEIVTDEHVVAGARRIEVTLEGGGTYPATLVGSDPRRDLALIQVHAGGRKLVPAVLGRSATSFIGEDVLAIGDALGYSGSNPSVTEGIVSAEDRFVGASLSCTRMALSGMLQTDAGVNVGSSGGPLVSPAGEVLGLDTVVATNMPDNAPTENIGFVIPTPVVLADLAQLRRGPIPVAPGPALGVRVVTLTAALRHLFGYAPPTGAIVDEVVSGSPAAEAGVLPGDVIVSFAGRAVTSARGLASLVAATRPGQVEPLGFYQGQRSVSVKVVIRERLGT